MLKSRLKVISRENGYRNRGLGWKEGKVGKEAKKGMVLTNQSLDLNRLVPGFSSLPWAGCSRRCVCLYAGVCVAGVAPGWLHNLLNPDTPLSQTPRRLRLALAIKQSRAPQLFHKGPSCKREDVQVPPSSRQRWKLQSCLWPPRAYFKNYFLFLQATNFDST